MAIYDGFFDAVLDEKTGEYDRAYSSGDFTNYFANIIGSGVCVHNDPDSFLVRLEGGKAVVSPGYLFIQGYWCKNDADHPIDLPGTGNYAIVAHLNLGVRMIELEARSVAQAYPDSLVLAIVSPTSAEDTRYNTDICGIIDTAGGLSQKVEWALNYIDSEIDSKLAQVEQDIAAQESKLDAKIAEVQAVADSIVPPPVGTIKFSASQDVGGEWLRCDGSFVNERDYPELVAALGKLIPSGDKFKLISDGEIGPQISNGVIYRGRMWVYSYSTQKLYGLDVEGTAAVKEIAITSNDTHFLNFIPPTTAKPLCLSIVPHPVGSGARLFLSQIIADKENTDTPEQEYNFLKWFLLFGAEFSGTESSISLTAPFRAPGNNVVALYNSARYVPYVISTLNEGRETYHCAAADYRYTGGQRYIGDITWDYSSDTFNISMLSSYNSNDYSANQRLTFGRSSKNELVYVSTSMTGTTTNMQRIFSVDSFPFGIFKVSSGTYDANETSRKSAGPVNVAGGNKVLFAFDKGLFPVGSISEKYLQTVNPVLSVPSAARIFVDAAAYLWGKDIFMIFVGTGIIFSRTLEEGDFGYLDTTSVLGTITQFGYLDYSQDEGTLYLLGQDTTNRVRAAKIVLNTLYDYANDGAWLPMIASDGIPAYIKAIGETRPGDTVPMTITTLVGSGIFDSCANVIFNGEVLASGMTYTRYVPADGTFTVGMRGRAAFGGTNFAVKMNGAIIVQRNGMGSGIEETATFNVQDFIASGITLQGTA